MRRVDPDLFRTALEEGLEQLHKGGVDAILMNMQYSPRTESMIALGPYSDTMRVVAQQRSVPLFDRLGIMRYWSDHGAFDLYAAGKDDVLAHRVHNCIGRGIAGLIIETGRLNRVEGRTTNKEGREGLPRSSATSWIVLLGFAVWRWAAPQR